MKRLTLDEFILKATTIHGGVYDYAKVVYVNSKSKVIIICPKHGEFTQQVGNHLKGFGCVYCFNDGKATNMGEVSRNGFIKRAKEVHGDLYSYDLVVYKSSTDKVRICCPVHGEFTQQANSHLKGCGCPNCREKYGRSRYTTAEFISKANTTHNNRYDYSLTVYVSSGEKVCIICPDHGPFWQTAEGHISGNGCSRCKQSKGESSVREILIDAGVRFEEQKRFDDCRLIRPLPFDFYLPDFDCCIEYDGEQHYHPTAFGTDNSAETKNENLRKSEEKDSIKTTYTTETGKKLIRIPYWKLKNAKSIIQQQLFNKETL